jgi:hypothetical protein
MRTNPPFIPRFLLNLFRDKTNHESLIGDFDEMYQLQCLNDRLVKARVWYWLQVLKALPSFIFHNLFWRCRMFKNYMKIAFRNIKNHKGYSCIHVSSLVIGITCCIFLLLWVRDELSFDRFHENANRLYRVEQDQPRSQGTFRLLATPYPLGPAMMENVPEIKHFTRIAMLGYPLVRYEDNAFYENQIRAVDPSFLRMFSFPLMRGDTATALDDPHSIVLTEASANKYFGSEDPFGKTMILNNMLTECFKFAP